MQLAECLVYERLGDKYLGCFMRGMKWNSIYGRGGGSSKVYCWDGTPWLTATPRTIVLWWTKRATLICYANRRE